MNNDQFTLAARTKSFSKEILIFCRNEQPTIVTRPIIDQLVRSATSVGANYAEANNAISKTDFRNKIFIAKKEAAETEYWLSLIYDFSNNKSVCDGLKDECRQLLMIFQKIASTLNHGSSKTARSL